ncbi:MAG: 4-hydroxy-3-methylbut-2-enyl diphosphate reductase [Nitrospirae bacterium]|nr:4-hydroxy-3-methylbut-2-enyl diphosphate reductase [Nitrospirota bacterium]MCL5063217.1 4-hydroxy-3-methylbut-2-enyl diphosphate reductase [Nitrospirota bacterium]MDA8213845.1 4-hydroxy-3-methylbut-2-enyl diphosphate reductase [Nitrospiraceae bacterium]MDA8337803.1 4-hydroxy-3-methylbut-2-enyl diphosphate reductase [Nitrospiraceae bacterium]
MSHSLKIVTAKRAGFCFGVKRAVDMAFDAAHKNGKNCCDVYTLGPIIHNPQVIEQLKSEGVLPTEDIDNPKIKTIIIRTHGVPQEISEKLDDKGYKVVDATCPFVKKAQQYAKLLKDDGYQVIIIGDRDHPEVKGLMSYAGEDVVVVNKDDSLPGLKSRVGIVIQTTQPLSVLKRFISDAVEQVKELKVFNTICNSTALRLKETKEMAKEADVMIVVGGKNSANTTQLARLCMSMSIPTYHIETADEIRDEWFPDAGKVGITAGASTPDWIIKDVEKRIRDIGGEG